jgi:biopolymer transport protein ExbD
MRHLPGANIKAEPNLVPLLDLVFQLIMFFMICVNFVSEQVNETIMLPIAQSARAMDKGEVEVLVLNMDDHGRVSVVGQPKLLEKPERKISFLRQYYADAKRTAEALGDPNGEVKTTVVVRAHQHATYAQVYELLNFCKQAKFKKIQLRATITNAPRGG